MILPSLRAFVEKMTQINRGRALYTRPDHLGEYMLVDYLAKKKARLIPGCAELRFRRFRHRPGAADLAQHHVI